MNKVISTDFGERQGNLMSQLIAFGKKVRREESGFKKECTMNYER
jgi:hypothetical protein